MLPPLPVIDLHCDLLMYLAKVPDADLYGVKDIGVTVPFMKLGRVRHQIMAVFAATNDESVQWGEQELAAYKSLLKSDDFYPVIDVETAKGIPNSKKIGITAAIENASVLALEDEPLDKAFKRLDHFIQECQHLFYISFTHHTENRFGGGNYSDNIGLKEDGKRLLEYMDGKRIAVDLAHASDNLAYGILSHIDAKSLDVPVIASHSNFRNLCDHVRNLPDELVIEVVNRKGLIGMNFLRAYIHPSNPEYLLLHILYGMDPKVAEDHLCFGADFFYRPALKDPTRIPLFFPEHIDATKYPRILQDLNDRGMSLEQAHKLAYQNAIDFMVRSW